MKRIDLHVHTDHSDGTVAPADLVRTAREAGLTAVAVTDHDTTSALAEAHRTGDRLGVEVLDGVEVSTQRDGATVHLLGYGFDLCDEAFQGFLLRVRIGREERNRELIARLAALGMPIAMEEVLAFVKGRIVARPHFARALVARGFVPDLRTAFHRWLGDGCPAYVEPDTPAPEEAVAAVAAAGGAAVLAHPGQVKLGGREEYRSFLRRLADAGLAGLEVSHPTHDPRDRALFASLAKEFDLVATGGSDFHGENKPHLALGTGDGTIEVAYETWERLRDRRRG